MTAEEYAPRLVLNALASRPGLTVVDLVEATALPEGTVRSHLSGAMFKRLVERTAERPYRYQLTEKGSVRG